MINIENVYFSYNKSTPIFNNLNLQISSGSFTSILGSNGCGKSTLIKLILKFLTADSGFIHINTDFIGYVPQKVETFNSSFPISVFEILDCHRSVLHIKSKDSISDALKLVGMQGFEKSLIGNLSAGQVQKIFIARALIGNPPLLILDELSNGVDAKSQIEIYELLKKLNKDKNVTILSIEHNLNAALNYSSSILEIKNKCAKIFDVYEYKQKLI